MTTKKSIKSTPFWIPGKIYLIRTVTMIDTGVLESIDEHEVILSSAAWIADTARFNESLKTLNFNEVEPFPEGLVAIGRGSIIDAVQITAAPRVAK